VPGTHPAAAELGQDCWYDFLGSGMLHLFESISAGMQDVQTLNCAFAD